MFENYDHNKLSLLGARDLVEEVSCFVQPVFTDVDILLSHALRATLGVGVGVHHAARPYHCLQGQVLIHRDTEHLIREELPAGLMERLMGPEIVMAKSKPLPTVDKGDTWKLYSTGHIGFVQVLHCVTSYFTVSPKTAVSPHTCTSPCHIILNCVTSHCTVISN